MFKHTVVWNRQGSIWAAIIFYAICGLLLILWPELALTIANTALSVALCATGVVMIVSYIRMSAIDALKGVSLALGLVLLCVGVLLLFNPDVIINLLPFVWGITLLAGGFGKVQIAFDLKRIGDGKWWLVLIGSLFSFVLGVLAVAQPAFIASSIMRFIGIALLVEAVLDIIAELVTGRVIHEYRKEHSQL